MRRLRHRVVNLHSRLASRNPRCQSADVRSSQLRVRPNTPSLLPEVPRMLTMENIPGLAYRHSLSFPNPDLRRPRLADGRTRYVNYSGIPAELGRAAVQVNPVRPTDARVGSTWLARSFVLDFLAHLFHAPAARLGGDSLGLAKAFLGSRLAPGQSGASPSRASRAGDASARRNRTCECGVSGLFDPGIARLRIPAHRVQSIAVVPGQLVAITSAQCRRWRRD